MKFVLSRNFSAVFDSLRVGGGEEITLGFHIPQRGVTLRQGQNRQRRLHGKAVFRFVSARGGKDFFNLFAESQ